MSKGSQRLQDEGTRSQVVVAGAAAGLVSRFAVAPLDVVKIRLQLQCHSSSNHPGGAHVYKGTIPTFRHIIRHEGITGLWKGNVPAEIMYVSYAAVQFTMYRSITLLLQRGFGEHTLPRSVESFVAGAGAGAMATTVTYPLDLLRTRFAAQGTEKVYTSLRHAIGDIRRDEGLRGFFRGIGPGIAQIVPFMGLLFTIYEGLRTPMAQLELPFGSGDATAGVIASVVAKTGVFPLDLVRRRIQVQGPTRQKYAHKHIPAYERGAARAIETIVKSEGMRGLYRGLTVSLLKAAPSSAVTMWTYEQVLRMLIERSEHGTVG